MRSAAPLRLLAASLALVTAASAAASPPRANGPFAYEMKVTPEEGPVDPRIDRQFTPAFAACQAQAQVTSQNADCFEAEFRRQDAKLNAAWRATLPRVSPGERKALVTAQRNWVKARDPFCRRDADGFSGGTIAPVVYSSCRVELTVRRRLWLGGLR